MRICLLFILVTSAVLAVGCNEQDVIYDMARFDRAFVPAVTLTASRDATGQSVLAIKRLKQDWDILSAKYAQIFLRDGAAGSIGGKLDKVDMLITTGDFQGAHKELESVSQVLMRARKRHGIDYFPDRLTFFHSSMVEIVSMVEGRNADSITLEDIREISKSVPVLRERWKAVTEASFDRKAFLFDKQSETALRTAVAEEAKAIDNLEAALRSGNRKLILKHILLLKDGFASVFTMFGNFESVSI